MKQSNNTLLSRIVRYLMLHGSFSNSLGLLTGKMGIALFFYEYSRCSGKQLYYNFAGEILDEVLDEIHQKSSVNFRDGLCGIGWAIEYLANNRFIKVNTDDILEEFDKKIVEWDVRRIIDFSLETGLKGIAYYTVARRLNKRKENLFITREYCLDLFSALNKNPQKELDTEILTATLRKILDGQKAEISLNPIYEITDKMKYNPSKLFESPIPLGIEKGGYSGVGFKLMRIL